RVTRPEVGAALLAARVGPVPSALRSQIVSAEPQALSRAVGVVGDVLLFLCGVDSYQVSSGAPAGIGGFLPSAGRCHAEPIPGALVIAGGGAGAVATPLAAEGDRARGSRAE